MMSSFNKSNKPSPKQQLQYHCASQEIDLQFCQWPETRFELVNGQFLVGGSLEGTRWLLKEALLGWGLDAAISFAPLDQWWEALRQTYDLNCQSETDWLVWADSLPLSEDYRNSPNQPLGSRYIGQHRWVRDHLQAVLMSAVGRAKLGKCSGPNYGMQLGPDMLTPDLLMLTVQQLAQDIFHDYYVETPAHLVIEIVLPEQREVDEQVRRVMYGQAQVAHYWTVDPVEERFQFWQWTPEGYQSGQLDSDGCYRGVESLSFSPEIFWLGYEQDVSPYTQKLPAMTAKEQPRPWTIERMPGMELGYGTVPFRPVVDLMPQSISVEQFVSWCPETKLEGPPFPLLGGETGTRNAIAMALMSLGLVETVKLAAGYEWVRSLRQVARYQQADSQRREIWWQQAREVAVGLEAEHGVGGVGVIGALVEDRPLNRWSQIHLVIWDVPEDFNLWQFWQTLPQELPFELTEAVRALPGEWQEISGQMQVLEGDWHGYGPRPQERMTFRWIEPND
ncbi:Uma2 family endonuclease [Leptolyngbya sp. Heron Island J]|uniref:Uma2 family endonuclease n=1 Tax=Leptolyngbya sp. Heron Island J TaxID=1385935 RepID=UPI0003F7512C|nr:Uma2 family endonuclease [Leptolyngbya sp. Heron Island J]